MGAYLIILESRKSQILGNAQPLFLCIGLSGNSHDVVRIDDSRWRIRQRQKLGCQPTT